MLPTTQAFLDRAVTDALAEDHGESRALEESQAEAPRARSTLRGALEALGIIAAVVAGGIVLRQLLAWWLA